MWTEIFCFKHLNCKASYEPAAALWRTCKGQLLRGSKQMVSINSKSWEESHLLLFG